MAAEFGSDNNPLQNDFDTGVASVVNKIETEGFSTNTVLEIGGLVRNYHSIQGGQNSLQQAREAVWERITSELAERALPAEIQSLITDNASQTAGKIISVGNYIDDITEGYAIRVWAFRTLLNLRKNPELGAQTEEINIFQLESYLTVRLNVMQARRTLEEFEAGES